MLARYSIDWIIDARLERLVRGGHVELAGGRFRLGPRRILLAGARGFRLARALVLGRGPRQGSVRP